MARTRAYYRVHVIRQAVSSARPYHKSTNGHGRDHNALRYGLEAGKQV